ncbi:head-tail joining protein [Sphingomonas sp.]|uniref:head-tail joining protein n=1 Tax=Sphingomonas sp. TaxID=28214 RepID=UPI003AFFA758
MSDPFVMALSALFSSPLAIDAIYIAPNATGILIRVIRSQPDAEAPFGQGRVVEGTNIFSIQRSDVATPAAGAALVVGAETFELTGEPMLDTEGLTWTMGAFPLP